MFVSGSDCPSRCELQLRRVAGRADRANVWKLYARLIAGRPGEASRESRTTREDGIAQEADRDIVARAEQSRACKVATAAEPRRPLRIARAETESVTGINKVQLELGAGLGRPADLVGRMAAVRDGRAVADRLPGAAVIGRRDIMCDERRRPIAPSLIDLEVDVSVRPALPRVGVERFAANADRGSVRQIDDGFATDFVGTDRQVRAIAQLPGIGNLIDAVCSCVAVVLLL